MPCLKESCSTSKDVAIAGEAEDPLAVSIAPGGDGSSPDAAKLPRREEGAERLLLTAVEPGPANGAGSGGVVADDDCDLAL